MCDINVNILHQQFGLGAQGPQLCEAPGAQHHVPVATYVLHSEQIWP